MIFITKNSIIKTCIMCNNNTILCYLYYSFSYFVEFRSITKHKITNTCKLHHKILYFLFWVNKRNKPICNFLTIKTINSYFSYSFFIQFSTCRFYIYNCIQFFTFFYSAKVRNYLRKKNSFFDNF